MRLLNAPLPARFALVFVGEPLIQILEQLARGVVGNVEDLTGFVIVNVRDGDEGDRKRDGGESKGVEPA